MATLPTPTSGAVRNPPTVTKAVFDVREWDKVNILNFNELLMYHNFQTAFQAQQ